MKRIADILFRSWTSMVIPLLLLLLTILLFELTTLDVCIQDMFYSGNGQWCIDFQKYHGWGLVYYTIPKWLLGLFGTSVLIHGLVQTIKKHICPWSHIYVLLCLLAIPGVIAALKDASNMPYPRKLVQYGGTYHKNTLKEAFLKPRTKGEKHFKGWPGGHASGGFALLSLAFVFASGKKRWFGFLTASMLGLFMGLGHTMDGNHFFSHTLVSYFIGWFIAALLYKILVSVQATRASRSCTPTGVHEQKQESIYSSESTSSSPF